MNGYVIVRTRHAGRQDYVARSGAGSSYTQRLENACVYPTREEAKRDLCPHNETVVELRTLLGVDLEGRS